MKTVSVVFRSIVLGFCFVTATAFADVHDIFVTSSPSNGNGAHWENGTVYNVPAGAEVDWSMTFDGTSGTGHILFGGCGFNVNVSSSTNFFDYGFTTSSGQISYQVSVNSSYPDDATAELVVAW